MADDELALEVILEYFNAVEAGVIAGRQQIKNRKLEKKDLFWQEETGKKGLFQQTSKRVNDNSLAFQDLQKRICEHGGFLKKSGHNYWFDNNNPDVIDRRKI